MAKAKEHKWKVGDKVLKRRKWLEEIAPAEPTKSYWIIMSFGHTKSGRRTAHIKHSVYDKYLTKWILYDDLSEYEGDTMEHEVKKGE